jgi:hypothetical protein
MPRGLLSHRAARLLPVLAFLCLLPGLVYADREGVPVTLSVDPGSIKQGDDLDSILKTVVTLQAPSPEYFVCEVRSENKSKISCSSIIFKKGDTEGVGLATVHWAQIGSDTRIVLTARNVETPDVIVSCNVDLQVKDGSQ